MEDPKLKQLRDRRAYYQGELKKRKRNRDERGINSAEVMVEHMQNQIDKLPGKRKVAESKKIFVPPVESAPSPDLCEKNKHVDEELQRLYDDKYNR